MRRTGCYSFCASDVFHSEGKDHDAHLPSDAPVLGPPDCYDIRPAIEGDGAIAGK